MNFRNPRRVAGMWVGWAAFLALLAGCQAQNPVGPGGASGGAGGSGSAVVTETLWKNGSWGTWFGASVIGYEGSLLYSNEAVPDTLDGDATTLLLETGVNLPATQARIFDIYTYDQADPDASSVLGGHLQFDAMLASPIAGTMTIAYSSNNDSACFWTTLDFATLSTAAFTHVSIPASQFTTTPDCSASTTHIAEPLYFSFLGQSGNTPLLYLDDIEWTSN